MTIDFCNLCGDPCVGKNPSIGNNNSQETWRTLVAQALCALATNTPGVAASVQLPQFSATFTQLTSSYAVYASPSFIDSGLTLRRLRVINNTDADIEISFDGSWWVCNHWCHRCRNDSLYLPKKWGKKGITIQLGCHCGNREWRRVFRNRDEAYIG